MVYICLLYTSCIAEFLDVGDGICQSAFHELIGVIIKVAELLLFCVSKRVDGPKILIPRTVDVGTVKSIFHTGI